MASTAQSFSIGNTQPSITPAQIITSAYMEIGHLAAGEDLDAYDMDWALSKLQRIIDMLGARRSMIYTVAFNLYTLIPNLAPHTIGPAGATFAIAQRPVRLESASVVIPNGVDLPIEVVGKERWAQERLKSLTNNFPLYVYYSPDVPNGTLNFWPIPTSAYPVRLEMFTNLPQAIKPSMPMVLPPGYWQYLCYQLAIELCPSDQMEPSQELVAARNEAKKTVMDNNDPPPRIYLSGGLPKSSSRRIIPDWNYLTGTRGN
jgi:hypothetical protein